MPGIAINDEVQINALYEKIRPLVLDSNVDGALELLDTAVRPATKLMVLSKIASGIGRTLYAEQFIPTDEIGIVLGSVLKRAFSPTLALALARVFALALADDFEDWIGVTPKSGLDRDKYLGIVIES